MKKNEVLISIVVPVFNEQEVLPTFHDLLITELHKIRRSSFEIIYVNDGSTDSTLTILTDLAHDDNTIKVINLSRNFGKEIATTAGISISNGDATIIMDGDGQHPANTIKQFIEKWRDGAQVVVGVRSSNQKEGTIKKLGSKAFYRLFNSISGASIVPRSTDFRLIDKVVRIEFLKFTERHRITRGLIDWLGFKRDYITFDAPARLAGEASYKTSQLVRLAMNSFVSLSLKPLFLFGWVGLFIIATSFALGIFIVIEQILLGDPLALNFSGPVILGTFMSFMIGLVLVSQAILATYISHIHTQTQDRPLFIIDPKYSVNLMEDLK